MIVQLAVVEWQPRGQVLVLDGAREGVVVYGPAPSIETYDEPVRVVWCNPDDEKQVREALDDDSDVRLVE